MTTHYDYLRMGLERNGFNNDVHIMLRAILVFLVMMIVSLFDPIRTPGFIISGWLIRNLAGALVVSFLWNLLLYVLIILPAGTREQSAPKMSLFLASSVGGLLLTYVVHIFATKRRRRKAESSAMAKKENQTEVI